MDDEELRKLFQSMKPVPFANPRLWLGPASGWLFGLDDDDGAASEAGDKCSGAGGGGSGGRLSWNGDGGFRRLTWNGDGFKDFTMRRLPAAFVGRRS